VMLVSMIVNSTSGVDWTTTTAAATCNNNWTSTSADCSAQLLTSLTDINAQRCWMISCVLTPFAIITVAGNALVMVAVVREPCLRASVTNHFIVSLAVADIIIGAVVMPFSIVLEATDGWWPFGADWCDLWHSLDVLASTASILNLSVIALDRYWAITDPIAYPRRMSTGRAGALIGVVWVCSAAISFPAIVWWRRAAAAANQTPFASTCMFTDDSAYLVFSSMISFYAPVSVILYAYYRIYAAAAAQIRSLERGTKVLEANLKGGSSAASLGGGRGETVTLRIHRGGGGTLSRSGPSGSAVWYNRPRPDSDQTTDDRRSPCRSPTNRRPPLRYTVEQMQPAPARVSSRRLMTVADDEDDDDDDGGSSTSGGAGGGEFARRWRTALVTRSRLSHGTGRRRGRRGGRLGRVARERKAAKTLGIVMGVFCACWVPFFVTNLLYGVCRHCVRHADVVFAVFTWLGYINSGMNPVIYACSLRDFRRAFARIVGYRRWRCWRCCCSASDPVSRGCSSPAAGIEMAASSGYDLTVPPRFHADGT